MTSGTYKYRCSLWLFICLCCAVVLSGCNEEDEADIFVGRTWKISQIFTASGKPVSEEDWKTLTADENRFYIKFENMTDFSGKSLTQPFYGTWKVNLKTREISFTFKNTGNPTDRLSKQVIESFKNIVSYKGDYNQLALREKESPAYILFRRISLP